LDVMPCRLVDLYQSFAGTCCLHLHDRRMSWVWKEQYRYREREDGTRALSKPSVNKMIICLWRSMQGWGEWNLKFSSILQMWSWSHVSRHAPFSRTWLTTLKIGAESSSETLNTSHQTTRRHIRYNSTLYIVTAMWTSYATFLQFNCLC
jgi:hypothetical protein